MGKCEQCIVRQFSALRALDKEELMRMSDCKTSHIIKKGEALFEEGDHINGVFCIKSGICKLTKLSPNGKNQIVKFIKRGDLLGQRSVISDEAVNLSAVAIDDMEVCFIPKEEVMRSFKENPKFTAEIIKDICHDLKLADDAIVEMAQKSVKQRLAGALLEFEDEFGVDADKFLRVTLSREEIANVVGTATESLIRILSEFSKKGMLETHGKKIKIANRIELERMADGF
ncbi:Crp/Fnr family transcriptional regulator [Zhouia spongiae]|uniref:Crp/Fnr family transcriptional regulator n=1 Tax=Zhouia spongiae TaxID=2202721 RepID=A0ABY3YNQ2_9FLAO|nr:Crp/Fnr family transcriptional regulator [Zhouia spongiae]UNY99174.1 Crp/Fnr family transcriptional regulator [Zhouia spongiae]